jgi:LacI family transcriptional regulator, galactose operon repressor
MSKLTQRELAARLGLSYATVSRAFNGDERVQEPTRRRVLEEAERIGFRGHSLARALRLKKSFAIGVIAVNSPHSYWTDVLAAMERQARAVGYHVIICHREAGASSAEEIRFLLDRNVDAIVLSPHAPDEDLAALRQVVEAGTPLLMLNNILPNFTSHYIGTDSHTGSRQACEYLLELGHRRIAFAAGPPEDYTAESRLAGYREAMHAAGVRAQDQQVIAGGWHREDGEAVARELMALPQRPTAIMCVNDPAAIGVYVELRRAGVRIPEEVSLIGYSGDRMGELLTPPLTTVRQDVERLGRRAAELVLDLIQGRREGMIFEELPDELLVRGSCAPPAAHQGF